MGSVAGAYDNSTAESFIPTLKRELIHRHSRPGHQTARTAVLEYIEGFLQHQTPILCARAPQPFNVRRG